MHDPPSVPLHVAEALRAACMELMADYGVQASWEPESPPAPKLSAFVAVAGFHGETARGVVALRATRGVLTETARQAVGPEASVLIGDWTCELANQLLGRLKNKLRGYSVTIDVHQPELVGLERLDELDQATRYWFSCEYGNFSGYLDLVLAPGFVLEKREVETESLAWEGDLILF